MSVAVPDNWLDQHAYSLVFFCLWAVLAVFFAWRKKFFQLPPVSRETLPLLSCWHVIGAFFIYLLVSIIVAPLVYGLLLPLVANQASLAFPTQSDPRLTGWLSVFTILSAGAALLLFMLCIGKRRRRGIYFPDGNGLNAASERIYKPFLRGAASWLLCYPVAASVGQVIAILLYIFFHYTETEQSVVHYLKQIRSFPILFPSMIFCLIAIIPIIEETIFRGFLQTWLKGHLGRKWAILLTAVIFSLFHFAPAQGMGNIEIVCSLFILALFLGLLYERMRSLWASIGLHMVFNGVSIALLFLFPSDV